MSTIKRRICSIILLVVLAAVVLSTLSACKLDKLTKGVEQHKDGLYYTVYAVKRVAVLHGFDKKYDSTVYEIPSHVRYKGLKYPVKKLSPGDSMLYGMVADDGIVTELIVPETVEDLDLNKYWKNKSSLQKITVSADNKYYASVDGVVYTRDLSELVFYPSAKVDNTLVIPRETSKISDYLGGKNNLSSIVVEFGNTTYSARDGVLFTADGKKMLCYPLNKTDETYTIPKTMSVLDTYCFEHNQYLKYLEVEQGNTMFSAYNGDLYSADSSIILYRPNEDVNYLELPDGLTTISYGALNRVRYLYVPKGLQRVVFNAYSYYDDVNQANPIANVRYIRFESDELPFCLRYVKFTGSVSFGVSREEFQAEIERAKDGGLL